MVTLDERKRFCENVKRKRAARDMSLQDVADKIEISRQAVHDWESGTYLPNVILAVQLAEVLGTSCENLVKGE